MSEESEFYLTKIVKLILDNEKIVYGLKKETTALTLQLKEARAEIEQLKALLTPQPSDLDMAIEMLRKAFGKAHAQPNFGEAYSIIMPAVDETIEELKRVRTVQNVKRNPES